MVIKVVVFFSIVLSIANASAAFSETENKELTKINESSQEELNLSDSKLKKVISDAVSDNPEKKEYILDVDKKWRNLIESKCDFETVESKGTDAEIATKNQCVAKGYSEEMEYFSHLMP